MTGESSADHIKRLKTQAGCHFAAAWHSWCRHVDTGKGKGQGPENAKLDPDHHPPGMIDEFLTALAHANNSVSAWSSEAGVYIDWALQDRLFKERQQKRDTANRGTRAPHDQSRGSGSSGAWTRDTRPRL